MVATMTMPAATITPDEVTLKLFPEGTQGIAFADVAGLRSTALFEQLLQEKMTYVLPRGMHEFIEQTGFSIVRDVDAVTVGRLGPRDMLIIARARYDRVRVEYFINNRQVSYETFMGRVVYHPNARAAVSFIDDLIVAGSDKGVKAAIERMGSAPPSSVVQNAKIMDKIRTLESGNQVWAVGEFSLDMIPRGLKGPPKAAALLQSFHGGAYQMRIDQDVHATAIGNFDTAENARNAGDLLRGLLAVAKLRISENQDLLHVLDGVRIDYSRETMTIGFDASGELLKRLAVHRSRWEPAQ
jgi:hypothetical protein